MMVTAINDVARGDRVELVSCADPDAPPAGTRGTVRLLDDAGTVHVDWDDGSKLGVIPGEDEFVVVEKGTEPDDLSEDIEAALADFDREETKPRVSTTFVPENGAKPVGARRGRRRNYRVMLDDKLLACYWSLSKREGEPYERCLRRGSGDPEEDLSVVVDELRARGLLSGPGMID